MTDTSSKTPKPPSTPPPAPKAQTATPRPSMQANEKLIGRAIIGSGAPSKRRG